jgi:hypothetical protein
VRKFGITLVLLLGAVAVLGATSASASVPTAVAATGTIVTVPGADLVDGDTFTIGDGAGGTVTFEFSSGAAVTFGHSRIGFTSSDSPAQVKNSVITAVNGASLAVTASSAGFAVVSLVNDTADSTGNVPITETVSDPGFTVLGMSGGGGTDDGTAAATAVGTIFTVRGAYLVDGDTFTIGDGAGGMATFEFSSRTVTLGHVRVGFTSSDSAAQVKSSVITAVNGASLAVTASSAGSAAVSLVNDTAGPAGNVPITETVSDPAFTVLGMAGGRDAVDHAPPADAPVVTGTTGSNGWYSSDVSVAWNWSDTGSGVDSANCTQSSITSGDGASVVTSSSCRDLAGNSASDSRTFLIDQSPPVVAVTGVTNGATYPLGSVPVALCNTTDTTSGVALPAAVTVTGGSNGVGGFTTTCSGADDNAGNHATQVSARYAVVYPFTGFFAPVDNPPIVNIVAAGKAIPLKFRLGGNRGLSILATGYPKSAAMTCPVKAPTDQIEQTVTAASSSLSYKSGASEYVYVWKTSKAWARSCRQLTIRLADGTDHIAYFKLT